MQNLNLHADVEHLANAVAERWCSLAAHAIEHRGRFCVALSGGRTPRTLYTLLACPAWRDRLPWQHTELYLGDERCVPAEHTDSNARMIHETLLDHLPHPPRFFPMVHHPEHPTQDAEYYARLLRERLCDDECNLPPRFDLVLLGMGADGHYASLFPGTLAAEDRERLVLPVYVEKLHSWRISLGQRVIAHARQRIVLVSGEDKRDTLHSVWHTPDSNLPIARLQRIAPLEWHVDQAAGSRLAPP